MVTDQRIDTPAILKQVATTRLLDQFLIVEPILFVGDSETLPFLKEHLQDKSAAVEVTTSHHFWTWQPETSQGELAAIAPSNTAIVVASLFNEQKIFDEIQGKTAVPVVRLFADVFTNLVAERPWFNPVEDESELPALSYAILTTPRSGSTYLCELLRATQRAGNPTEHLRQVSVTLSQSCGFDYLRFLRAQMKFQTTPNGVFGTKFISHFLFDLQGCSSQSGHFDDIFKQYISKFVYLIREDKVAQAVSAVVAKKTKIWHIFRDEKQQAYQQQTQTLTVDDNDLEAVHRVYQSLINQEAQFEKLIDTYQLSPLVLHYEQLASNPEPHLTKLLAYLDISTDGLDLVNLKTKSQRLQNDFSQMLIDSYNQKYRGFSHHGLAL
ncbi:MAG: Stf0 sulfotransferase family protein [Leptolyngbya sp. Prado105]|nr:Stf0 sulfotransferase family protein [Leptolyngbya sp. Prado105]